MLMPTKQIELIQAEIKMVTVPPVGHIDSIQGFLLSLGTKLTLKLCWSNIHNCHNIAEGVNYNSSNISECF